MTSSPGGSSQASPGGAGGFGGYGGFGGAGGYPRAASGGYEHESSSAHGYASGGGGTHLSDAPNAPPSPYAAAQHSQQYGRGVNDDDDDAEREERRVWSGLLGAGQPQNHLHGFAGGGLRTE